MSPPATLGALLILLALVPGWLYLRLVERLQPPSGTSGLHQLLEVLAVGVATTGVAAFVVLLVPHRILPFTLDVGAWAVRGDPYLRAHSRQAVWSVALTFALALAIAYGLHRAQALKRPAEFRGNGNVWVHSLGDRPANKVPYVGLQLDDGRLVEGPLHSYTLDDKDGARDLALQKPIRITPADETMPQPLPDLDRFIVSSAHVSFITVIHVPADSMPKRDRWWRRLRPNEVTSDASTAMTSGSSLPEA